MPVVDEPVSGGATYSEERGGVDEVQHGRQRLVEVEDVPRTGGDDLLPPYRGGDDLLAARRGLFGCGCCHDVGSLIGEDS